MTAATTTIDASAAPISVEESAVSVVETFTSKTGSSFRYVRIPADSSKPIEECIHTGVAELQNDSFIEKLKKEFTDNGECNPDILKAGLAHHAKDKEAVKNLTDDMMAQIMKMATIDIFPLLLPLDKVGNKGVSVYVDDKGVAKNLPFNERASFFAREIGYANQEFRGDAYVARVEDSEAKDIWRRIDFPLADLSSTASWVAQAKEQVKNKKSQGEVNDFKNMMTNNPAMVNGNTPALTNGDRVTREHGYFWRDSTDDVEVTFYVNKDEATEPTAAEQTEEEAAKGASALDKKKVKVAFKKSTLTVSYDGKQLFGAEALSKTASLFGTVDTEECTWSIVDKVKLVVTLVKQKPEAWKSVVPESK
ncbi:unnamed protein product [Amoebophrya sp. A25]|nr:unnamed protein product [Amoebophrya sp. A25]|eukprot:GSA25T00011128001.1